MVIRLAFNSLCACDIQRLKFAACAISQSQDTEQPAGSLLGSFNLTYFEYDLST